jgi:hypothetical protein
VYTKEDLKGLRSYLKTQGQYILAKMIWDSDYNEKKLKVVLFTWHESFASEFVVDLFFCPFKEIPKKVYDHPVVTSILSWRLSKGI